MGSIVPTATLNLNNFFFQYLSKRPETSGLFETFIWENFDVVG